MAWVRFTAIHEHRFSRQMKRYFQPGEVRNLPAAVAWKAVMAGHAVKMKRPTKAAAEVDDGEGRV